MGRDIILVLLGLSCSSYVSGQIYDPFSYRTGYQQYMNRLVKYPLISQSGYYNSPYEKEEVDLLSNKPFYGGYLNFRRQGNAPNNDVYLKVPKQKILSMVSPQELALLYQQNLAYDVPVNNPLEPQQIAISSVFVENLLKVQKGIGTSVHGAANFVGGLFDVGHGILGALGDTAKNVFWVNQGRQYRSQ